MKRKNAFMAINIWRTRLGAINRVFAPIWTTLGMNISSKEFLEKFLSDPTIETLREIYLSAESDSYKQYMMAHIFNIAADAHLRRTGRSLNVVDPRLAEWNYDRQGIEPIPQKYLKYIEVVVTVQVTGIRYEDRPYTYSEEVPDKEYKWQTRTVQRTKLVEVAVEDTIEYNVLRFTDEFTSYLMEYTLSPAEEKRYKQLQEVCKALNTLYKGAPAGKRADFMRLLYIDPQSQQFKPVETVDANTFNF